MESPVSLFIGEEKHLKQKAIGELRASLARGSSPPGDLDYKLFYANETPVRDILDCANTPPFLSSKRLIVVKDLEKLSPDEKRRLISYLKNPYKNTRLILDVKNESLLKDDLDLARYVDIRRFDHSEDAETVSAFDLAWVVGKKNAARALMIINDLVSDGKRAHEIMGPLCWHFRRLLRARALVEKGESNYSITSTLNVRKSDIKDFFMQVKAFDIGGIKRRLRILREADLDMKKSRCDPRLILEIAVIRLCLGK